MSILTLIATQTSFLIKRQFHVLIVWQFEFLKSENYIEFQNMYGDDFGCIYRS